MDELVWSAELEQKAIVAGRKDWSVNLHVRRFALFCHGCAKPAFSPKIHISLCLVVPEKT
jgi:hypothetical protein